MEKYFKPVHSPSDPDKSKLQKHHNQQHPHHQEPRSDRYITCDYTDRNTDESYGHRYDQHGHYYHNICSDVHLCHQTKPFPQCEEDDIVHDHTSTHVTLSRASSSSSLTSSSSSTSSTSWYTEASASDIFSHSHAERPQHSLSCSNIHDVRRFYQLDDSSDPIVFATIKHGSNGSICNDVHRASEKGKQVFAPLDCGHSRSNDGFLQGDERKIAKSHLNRSLCFSEEDIMLGVTKGPKRAVSSSQLPSKGILKNKEPHSDIRKAKSMEVLSPRVAKEQSLVAQQAKGPAQVDIEQARENFVQEKLKFSAFLDEITKQVISPSDLKILGLNANNTAGLAPLGETPDPPKPQLPPKKHRESSVEGNEQKHQSKHVKAATSSTRKHSDPAKSDRLSSYVAMHHHGSPPPHSIHHKSTRKDRRPPSTEASGYGRSGSHLTDGTSTSPELIQPRQRHKLQPTSQSPLSHVLHRGTANSLPSSSHGSGAGLGSESSSSKSDSSRTRETVSTATSSEQSGHYHSQHTTLSGQHRGTQCEADHLQALQEENADLHQNLLQTVVCIENLEAELQRTRDELIHVKEKYKSLLESHSGAQQANHLLQDHLHAGAETLNNERQCMFTRVAQLTSELEDAHRTIKALENINVPNLIKESLEKHLFASAGTKEQFMSATTQFSQLASSPKTDNHSYTPKVEGASHDWLSKLEGGPQRPTAFTPFKHGKLTTENQSCISGSLSHCSPSFSSADASTAFYKKFMSGFATGPQPICVQPLLGTTTTDMLLPNVQQTLVGGDNCAGKGEVKLVLSEQANVTAMSAQQILNDFMQQLRAQKEPDRDTTQQGEWGAGATEQIGKAGE